jgi:hypothetical protein
LVIVNVFENLGEVWDSISCHWAVHVVRSLQSTVA